MQSRIERGVFTVRENCIEGILYKWLQKNPKHFNKIANLNTKFVMSLSQ